MHSVWPLGPGCFDPTAGAEPLVTQRSVRRGAFLFMTGENFRNLFAVRSGFFKALVSSTDGREQVTGFYMGGDMMGLDGIGTGFHTASVVALEDSEVCIFPFERIMARAAGIPELHARLQRSLSDEIARDHRVMLMLGSMQAEERVAAFLVDLMGRLRARGWSGSETVLRMTRQEIGNFLGLTLETVSRAFSDMVAEGILDVKLRHVRVLDQARLEHMASDGARGHRHNPRPERRGPFAPDADRHPPSEGNHGAFMA